MKQRATKRLLCLAFAALLLGAIGLPAAASAANVPYQSYTYWDGYPGDTKQAVYSRPMYEPARVLDAARIGGQLAGITDLCVDGDGNVYLLDGEAAAIVMLDKQYAHVRTVDALQLDGERLDFAKARGIYAGRDGYLYLCDTEHARVLKIDREFRVTAQYRLPDSELIPEEFQYRPLKMALDSKGNVYVLSDGSYYGALVFTPEGAFSGFFGANAVSSSVLDILAGLWNRLFMNNEKRAQMESRLPYQFVDLSIDEDDFVYTCTGRTDSKTVQTGQIRCFSPGGRLTADTSSIQFADMSLLKLNGLSNTSDLLGLTVDEDGFLYTVDSASGHVFCYNSEYELLSVFGGGMMRGVQQGVFTLPVAIDVNGEDVLVCDGTKNTVTVFRLTAYGRLVKDMCLLTDSGDYLAAKDGWSSVLQQDRNSQLAYEGLSKAAFAEGQYEQAMQLARDGLNRDAYALAFREVRRQTLARYFPLLFALCVLLVAGIFAVLILSARKQLVLIRHEALRTMCRSVPHPFDTFAAIKEKRGGSIRLCLVLLLALYVVSVLQYLAGGYLFVDYNPASFNSLHVLIRTVGVVLLWTLCNWAVCALMGGIGKAREILIVTCYSLQPLIVGQALYTALSNVLLPEEAGFLQVLLFMTTLYAAIMLIVGMMKIHDFGLGKFLGTALLSVVAMAIVLFLLFVIVLLMQQFGAFLLTLIQETIYR